MEISKLECETKFELSDSEWQRFGDWHKTLLPKILEKSNEYWMQRMKDNVGRFNSCTHNGTMPYYGTIGGGITFMFTPTGMGNVIRVRESFTKEETDITDDNW